MIADLVDVTRMHTADPEHRVPHLAFQPDQLTDVPFLPMDDVETSYYLRMRVTTGPACWPTSRACSPTATSRSTR